MRDLDKSKVYDLSELTSEEWNRVISILKKQSYYGCNYQNLDYYKVDNNNITLYFNKDECWVVTSLEKPTANAKELFYTLENVQVDCSELTEEQIEYMCKVFISNGYKMWDDPDAFKKILNDDFYLRLDWMDDFYMNCKLDTKTTITYEKFIELFGYKEKSEEFKNLVEVLNEELTEEAEYEVKYIAEKPQQYQPHYNNENGSLYKIATDLGLNHWEFDIFKRLVRCRKKNQFKEDLQKIKDTIDIYLNEYSE